MRDEEEKGRKLKSGEIFEALGRWNLHVFYSRDPACFCYTVKALDYNYTCKMASLINTFSQITHCRCQLWCVSYNKIVLNIRREATRPNLNQISDDPRVLVGTYVRKEV